MDAALEQQRPSCIDVVVVRATGRDEVVRLERGALRRHDRVVGQLVQQRDDPATELRDVGERVHLPAPIDREKAPQRNSLRGLVFSQSGRVDLNHRPPGPEAATKRTDVRRNAVLTRCSGQSESYLGR